MPKEEALCAPGRTGRWCGGGRHPHCPLHGWGACAQLSAPPPGPWEAGPCSLLSSLLPINNGIKSKSLPREKLTSKKKKKTNNNQEHFKKMKTLAISTFYLDLNS